MTFLKILFVCTILPRCPCCGKGRLSLAALVSLLAPRSSRPLWLGFMYWVGVGDVTAHFCQARGPVRAAL